MRRAYRAAYPWANTAFEVWLLVYNVAYLFERTAYHRPWLSWVGVDLRRLSVDDVVGIILATLSRHRLTKAYAQRAAQAAIATKAGKRPPDTKKTRGLLELLTRLLWKSPRLFLDSLRVLLPTAIFFIKFLEWWYSPSSPARALSAPAQGPAVPPPPLHAPHPQGVRVDDVGYGVCPLCREAIANATALPSGYVFCYRCAHDWVEKHGRCPVTLARARVWQLRKILV